MHGTMAACSAHNSTTSANSSEMHNEMQPQAGGCHVEPCTGTVVPQLTSAQRFVSQVEGQLFMPTTGNAYGAKGGDTMCKHDGQPVLAVMLLPPVWQGPRMLLLL